MVSLVFADAIWKLGKDVQYLFVYRPTKDFTMSVTEMEETYKECYGRKLNPRIYAHTVIQKLMKNKNLRSIVKVRWIFKSRFVIRIFQFDEENGCISLSMKSRYEVFTALACELLFLKGPDCKTFDEFMTKYMSYYGVPLLLEQLNVENLESLVNTDEVSPFIKVHN